ncbi:hypothetical protein Acr_00g0003550 [Actinidia rufa]|uniref:Uncharacterized protein n=1 Tax=Actinidia rufa TaxID=165716 RepID=A0A7J0D8V0_9ERIC|nr:hypothetical protein Acr_00g0003550 [Actinidia rufa]
MFLQIFFPNRLRPLCNEVFPVVRRNASLLLFRLLVVTQVDLLPICKEKRKHSRRTAGPRQHKERTLPEVRRQSSWSGGTKGVTEARSNGDARRLPRRRFFDADDKATADRERQIGIRAGTDERDYPSHLLVPGKIAKHLGEILDSLLAGESNSAVPFEESCPQLERLLLFKWDSLLEVVRSLDVASPWESEAEARKREGERGTSTKGGFAFNTFEVFGPGLIARVRVKNEGEERDSEAQPTGEDKIINQGFQCPIGKKEELFNPRLEKRSCNIIPLGRSTYQSARITRNRASEALEVKYIEIGGLRVNTSSLAPVNKHDLFLYQTGLSGLQSVTMLRSGQHCSFQSA